MITDGAFVAVTAMVNGVMGSFFVFLATYLTKRRVQQETERVAAKIEQKAAIVEGRIEDRHAENLDSASRREVTLNEIQQRTAEVKELVNGHSHELAAAFRKQGRLLAATQRKVVELTQEVARLVALQKAARATRAKNVAARKKRR